VNYPATLRSGDSSLWDPIGDPQAYYPATLQEAGTNFPSFVLPRRYAPGIVHLTLHYSSDWLTISESP